MSLYIGEINGKWYHTYSKKLRDKYFGKKYVVIYSLGTGKDAAMKIRGSKSLSYYERRIIKGGVDEVEKTESGQLIM